MKTLEQIKDDYAVSKGYNNFCDIIFDFDGMDIDEVSEHIDEVMKIYARECLKLASENAEADYESWGDGSVSAYVVCESITNENNIIK